MIFFQVFFLSRKKIDIHLNRYDFSVCFLKFPQKKKKIFWRKFWIFFCNEINSWLFNFQKKKKWLRRDKWTSDSKSWTENWILLIFSYLFIQPPIEVKSQIFRSDFIKRFFFVLIIILQLGRAFYVLCHFGDRITDSTNLSISWLRRTSSSCCSCCACRPCCCPCSSYCQTHRSWARRSKSTL